ncbi:hypothetical protein JCM5353_000027, partial [Sporobolomyces roseus]
DSRIQIEALQQNVQQLAKELENQREHPSKRIRTASPQRNSPINPSILPPRTLVPLSTPELPPPRTGDPSLLATLRQSLRDSNAEFKPGQEEALVILMQQRVTLCVLPTGGGKTALIIAPILEARKHRGPNTPILITVIVVPTVALQNDLYDRLRWANIRTMKGEIATKPSDVPLDME